MTDLVRRQAQQRNALTLPRPSGAGVDAEHAHAEGSSSDGTMPPPVVVHAVLNPLSKAAQRLAPLIGFLRDLLDAEAMLLLNPKVRLPRGVDADPSGVAFWLARRSHHWPSAGARVLPTRTPPLVALGAHTRARIRGHASGAL